MNKFLLNLLFFVSHTKKSNKRKVFALVKLINYCIDIIFIKNVEKDFII
jgi:hypothetical protein